MDLYGIAYVARRADTAGGDNIFLNRALRPMLKSRKMYRLILLHREGSIVGLYQRQSGAWLRGIDLQTWFRELAPSAI